MLSRTSYRTPPNTTGSLAVFGPAAERTTYHRALVFKDPGGKVCTKACCMNQLHGGYRSIKLKDKQSGEELAGVKLRQARLQKQVEDQKAKFLQLSELVGEVLNVEQATGEDDADVIEFELQSVGKQMLQRLDHISPAIRRSSWISWSLGARSTQIRCSRRMELAT